eukprot:m.167230 g.167230  ORF g.167230 m.167230 type:complete len:400 (-) comp12798_c0_seq1:97-1296(-)
MTTAPTGDLFAGHDGLIEDVPSEAGVLDAPWLDDWSTQWTPESVEAMGSLTLLSSSSSEASLMSNDAAAYDSLSVDEIMDCQSSPLVPTLTIDDESATDTTVPTPAPKRSKKSVGKDTRRRLGSPKPTGKPASARKAAPSPRSRDTSPGAAARAGSFFDILTDEERMLMEQEGISVPKRGPLSNAAERELKRLRRQVKNKYSAKDSRKKRKEYIDSLEATNADLSEQLQASRREMSNLRVKLNSVQSLFRPAAKASASMARKSAVLLLCLLFSRQQHGMDVGSASLAELLGTRGDGGSLASMTDGWSSDEGTESPTEEQDDEELPTWMTKGLHGIPGTSRLSDVHTSGVLEAARKGVATYISKHALLGAGTMANETLPGSMNSGATDVVLGIERNLAVQ